MLPDSGNEGLPSSVLAVGVPLTPIPLSTSCDHHQVRRHQTYRQRFHIRFRWPCPQGIREGQPFWSWRVLEGFSGFLEQLLEQLRSTGKYNRSIRCVSRHSLMLKFLISDDLCVVLDLRCSFVGDCNKSEGEMNFDNVDLT